MKSERYSRQTFLGPGAQAKISDCRIGIVGLGGGGSHVVQQLAHYGFLKYCLFDHDIISISNLNRTVGATEEDVKKQLYKVEIFQKLILSLQKDAEIICHKEIWQKNTDDLKKCQIIVGCLDRFDQRRELEIFARRHGIPYIDIGLSVAECPPEAPVMAGQIILSVDGQPCMRCMGFLTDKNLEVEAATYGHAGPSPQVVSANGVLASTAVNILVDLVTGWTGKVRKGIYLQYEANTHLIQEHVKLKYAPEKCPHFASDGEKFEIKPI